MDNIWERSGGFVLFGSPGDKNLKGKHILYREKKVKLYVALTWKDQTMEKKPQKKMSMAFSRLQGEKSR